MRKLILSIIISFIFILSFRFQSDSYSVPNSYKCSIGEYQDCIVDGSCWGAAACGRSPTAEGLTPICPTGYHCFCDPDNPVCQCVECTSGCSDPYGYFTNPGSCPPPTCDANGYTCLPWGDSGCSVFNSSGFSCTWYNEACCTSLSTDYNCSGDCNYPGQMKKIAVGYDSNDDTTWCPAGWDYGGVAGRDKVCAKVDGSGNIIDASICCENKAVCPGVCAASCPPATNPELDGVSLDYVCNAGLCCVENVVEPSTRPRPFGLLYTGPVIKNLQDILGPVSKMLYYGGLAIGVFFIILSGYRLMTSEGDPQRTKAAQEQLTSAIIGIIFILLSVTILRVVINEILKIGTV